MIFRAYGSQFSVGCVRLSSKFAVIMLSKARHVLFSFKCPRHFRGDNRLLNGCSDVLSYYVCSIYVTEPVTTGVTNIFMLIWVVLCASLEKLVECLDGLSAEYRDVSCKLSKEKAQDKAKRLRVSYCTFGATNVVIGH